MTIPNRVRNGVFFAKNQGQLHCIPQIQTQTGTNSDKMSQTKQILETLKKELRASGFTYADVAKALDLSEASVKRLFSDNGFTLQRFEKVCALIGLDIADLIEISQRRRRQLEQLTESQEKEIAEDLLLLMVTVSVLNGFDFSTLLEYYTISEHECIQKLAKLDRLKLIELLPGNRIKLRVSSNFRWLPRGPIENFFHERVKQDFFNSRFESENEKIIVLNGLFSETTRHELQDKMEQYSLDFETHRQKDLAVAMSEKQGTTMVIAMRQWQYSLFDKYVRHREGSQEE